ncbi:type III polyketide synthase [Actinopolymorpha alba]|uniref:type III polyketide synthase n=1 Tax=Actinopolymorpha alba TaxID=533267 RepID=UPI00036D9D47|nr:3-oxoacyl-[acyl-carrier-protein] synthase III C-terminal domain-containing protein [Actinopolymorpha alba]
MTRIASVHGVPAPYRYAQRELTDAFARLSDLHGTRRQALERFHTSSTVQARHLALPLDDYPRLHGFGAANDAFIASALDLGGEAITGALADAGISADEVDLLAFTSTTGVAAPSIDARLVQRLGLRPDVKRLPLFGLGCAGGAAGLARVHDYLTGWPEQVAVLLSVELCSLTLQRADVSVANLVASALFSDGAAAVVMTGERRTPVTPARGPRVVATRSQLYPDSERVMAWNVSDSGFRIVLGAEVPDVVRAYLGGDVRAFLADHDLKLEDITTWVCHPGGPKVLDAVAETLGLPADALDVTWHSLATIGNLSSASVLFVLRDTLARGRTEPGTPGVLLALGPGFCSELVLLEW